MSLKNKKIFIGPIKEYPSWAWAGLDLARELSKYYEVSLFFKISEIADADAVLLVKDRLNEEILRDLKTKAKHIVYVPVDFWETEDDFLTTVPVLKLVDMIFIHSERMVDQLQKFGIKSIFVEHHNKYALRSDLGFKENGKVLWIGGYEHTPWVIDYLVKNSLNLELDLLTSPDSGSALAKASKKFALLGNMGDFKEYLASLNGFTLTYWTEKAQKELMERARAGIDIKNPLIWEQIYKPPTKAQQFISSGIPFACNKESYQYEYFHKRGFELPEPINTNRWFSYEYWQETHQFKSLLNELTSLTAVGHAYKTNLDLIL